MAETGWWVQPFGSVWCGPRRRRWAPLVNRDPRRCRPLGASTLYAVHPVRVGLSERTRGQTCTRGSSTLLGGWRPGEVPTPENVKSREARKSRLRRPVHATGLATTRPTFRRRRPRLNAVVADASPARVRPPEPRLYRAGRCDKLVRGAVPGQHGLPAVAPLRRPDCWMLDARE